MRQTPYPPINVGRHTLAGLASVYEAADLGLARCARRPTAVLFPPCFPIPFTPHVVSSPVCARGCYTCTHFHSQFLAEHLVREHRGGTQVIGTPKMGRAYWEREPGSDDE